ncbi:MAG: hypothetical protein [Caudoviricetes sp.]|nr:MAG: hypothetical protein [Caudoviricetes sp.]
MQIRQVQVNLNDEASVTITETEILVLGDRQTISSSRILRDSGEMIAPVTIARTGIMLYKAKELGDLFSDRDPESTIRVRTKPEVLFDQATIDSCRSLPITIGHPKDDVDLSNNKTLQKGFIEGLPLADGSMLSAYAVLNDSVAIRLVDSGIDQVSLGHTSKLVRCDGDPEADCDKTTIRGNHLAIVRTGRAQTTRIGDTGEEVEIVDKSVYDVLEAQKDALALEVGELNQKLADSVATKLTDEQINELVETRVKARTDLLIEVAKLGDEYSAMDFAGKSELEIKSQVVSQVHGRDVSAKSEDYIQALFDTALEKVSEVTLSDALSTSMLNNKPEEKKPNAVEEAKARRLQRYNKP